MIFNLVKDDYYTQRNNQRFPGRACMPTERVMFYLGNKMLTEDGLAQFVAAYNAKNGTAYQADDVFMSLLNTPEALAFCAQKYPWAAPNGNPPNEVHGMYNSYLDQLVLGRRVSDFRQDLTFEEITQRVQAGQHIMTCGEFPAVGYYIDGHAFGFDGVDDEGQLLSTDPWGNPWTLYTDANGYLVPWTREQFVDHVHPKGQLHKWGHIPTV